jgi:hypothetical protein
MSVRNAFASLLAIFGLLFLGACGSSSPKAVAPPTGGFNASTLNGTYVFSTAGFNADGYFMAIVGALQANGSGGVSGTVDVVTSDPALGVSPNQAISSGSYKVGPDGRGQIVFNVNTTGNGATGFTLDFVLSSSSHGLITEFDNVGSGSGTIDLQGTVAQPTGSYTFSIAGTGPGQAAASFATVGTMTLGSSGAVSAGVQDFNNGGGATTDQAILTSSSVTAGTGTTPGVATLATALGTFTFDVYAIDSTHFKLVETDGQLILLGDAFTQSSTLPTSSTLTYTMSGSDGTGLPVSVAGFMPLDGNSNVTSGALEDFNDNGTVGLGGSFGGGFSALAGGRSVLTLTGFQNGSTNDIAGTYVFAAYPFTSNGVTGMELLEIDGLGVTSGTAYVQTGTDFAASQGYGLNVSAVNTSQISSGSEFEEDDIAEFTATSSTAFSGIEDVSDEGISFFYDQSLSGAIAAGPTGEFAVTINANNNFNLFTFNLYAVNDSTFLVLETDGAQIGTGVVEIQNSSATPGGEPGIIHPQARPGAHVALRRR